MDVRRSSGGSRSRRRTVAAVGGVAAAALLVGGCGGGGSVEDAEPETRTFSLGSGSGDGKSLVVDSDDSALDVVTADVRDVRVTRWFDGKTVLGSKPKVSWGMEGDRLTLRVECAGLISACDARHRVEVPRDVVVSVESQDGPVTASGFGTALKVRSEDGRILVKDSGGALDLGSLDGAVEVSGGRSKDVRATAEDGRVRLALEEVPDRVAVVSRDGSVSIELPEAAYKVTTRVRDGSVDVGVPRDEDSPHVVSVESHDGRVTVGTAA